MSIRPVLRAVPRPSTESTYLSGLEDQTRRGLLSGGYRIAAVSLKGVRFLSANSPLKGEQVLNEVIDFVINAVVDGGDNG